MSADEGPQTTTMSTTNGELHAATPDPPALSTPGKRKRVSSHDEEASSSASQAQEKVKLEETLRNLVEILAKNDTDLHLLSCPLPSSPSKPRSKRAKTSGDKEEGTSIESRVAQGRYNTLQEFLSDIEKASATVIEGSKAQANGEPADGTPLTETVNRIAAFKKVLNSLVRQAYVSPSNVKAEASEDDADAPAQATTSNMEIKNENLVLTLFGNPSNPKQLYSSLQKSVRVPLSSEASEEKYVEVQAPLSEIGLPNGINTTKATPFKPEDSKESKRTFGEVFAPRSTLPQLEPPRRARSSSRNAFNAWNDPFEAATNFKAFPGERNNYCLAPLPSGQWLQYGGVTSSPSFWSRRQKQQSSQSHGEERYLEDPALWADDDPSLLQGIYSSFAPSFDSSGAIVQADAKDMVWWGKRGAKRLHTLLSIPYQEEESEPASTGQPGNIGELDESALEEMVKNFNPEDFANNITCTDTSKDEAEEQKDKEMDDVLRDVSELLETLSSYQRIRALDPSTSNKQGTESKETPSDAGNASTPSEAERSVYETLKMSLSTLLMTLPPYAVAKLDGDQLADLNISQKVLVENTDYRGTMEKDDYTMQQERAAAVASAAGSVNRNTASRSGAYQPGYNSRAYATNTRVQQTPGGFQAPQPYYGARQPSTSGPSGSSGPYTPGHPQSLAASRPPATPSQRPGYAPYPQATPQIHQGNAVPQMQRPGQNGYNPYAAQQTPAQASPQPYTPRPGQQPAYNVPYGQGRNGSPQKQPQYTMPQARAQYMTPGSTNPQQRYLPQQQPQQQPGQYTNYPSNQAPPQSGYANSAAAMTYARSAAEQAALMDRNKAQLAAHQNRQSSTPQPATDHTNSQDRSATPSSKQNGTPVPT